MHSLRHLLHPLKIFWNERATLFWPIWMGITALAVVLVPWVVRGGKSNSPVPVSPPRRKWTRKAVLSIAFLSLFLTSYIAGSLVWEDFTYYDESHFTDGTLAGRDISVAVSPEADRFWPLGYQEFNLLRHFTRSVNAYHALRIAQLVVVVVLLLVLDGELSVQARVGLIVVLLITPSILISFSGLIYAEANVVFWLICLIWFLERFKYTDSISWAVAAVVSAQLLIYYKETAFLLLFGFTVGRLLLRCRGLECEGWDFKRIRTPEGRLDTCLALLVVPFIFGYIAVAWPYSRGNYLETFRLSLPQVLGGYFKLDFLIWIFVCVALTRGILILRRTVVPSTLWDGLALGGLVVFAGYIILRIESAYYLAPADLIAVLYLGRLAILSMGKMRPRMRLCVIAIICLVIVQDTILSAFRTYERKNVIHAKAEIAGVIQERYQSDPQGVKRLFFPFAKPFYILEFASYLNYIGVPVEEVSANSDLSGGVQLVGKAVKVDGPCGYIAFVCHPGGIPDQGDLVVILPDDFTSVDESSLYLQRSSTLLISYDPWPPIPRWMLPYVSRLHIVSPAFPFVPLPNSWLKASVFVWK